jgi:hypothetical protein
MPENESFDASALVAAAMPAMVANADRFDELLGAAGATTDPTTAAAHAERAARFGWRHHPGAYSSTELERLVEDLGLGIRPPLRGARTRRARPHEVHRVLHVLTAAHDTGGHGRLAWNWIRHDHDRRHDVVVLEQLRRLVPYELARAAQESGGRLLDLTAIRPGYTRQIGAVAELADTADVVVLHHHPFDVVPGLALADPDRRPPVVVVNHAGRVFGTGYAVADAVAWLRPAIAGLLHPRRGVPENRLAWLPIPLTPPAPPSRVARMRRRTRARLGMPEHGVCAVTMAGQWKYRPIDDVSLPDLLAEATTKHDNLHVLVIGPRPTDGWADAIARSRGRMRVLGPQPSPQQFLAAADFAVDSHPISSETSVRDEALEALPVIALTRFRDAAPACALDLPGPADELLVRAASPKELGARIDEMVSDADARTELGIRFRDAVAQQGVGAPWLEQAELVYERAIESEPMSATELGMAPRWFDATDAITLLSTSGPDRLPSVDELLHTGQPGRPRFVPKHVALLRARHAVARVVDRLKELRQW